MQSDPIKIKRKPPHRQKKQEHHTNAFWFCVKTGFFAGLFWGTLHWILYTIHFTTVLPAFMADPFFQLSFLMTGWGTVVGIGCFIIFSIAAALIYKFLLGRFSGPWAGVAYGLLWCVILFLAIGPVLNITKPVQLLGLDTIITELCIYIIWGLFIGYTIAFEYTDEASREPIGSN